MSSGTLSCPQSRPGSPAAPLHRWTVQIGVGGGPRETVQARVAIVTQTLAALEIVLALYHPRCTSRTRYPVVSRPHEEFRGTDVVPGHADYAVVTGGCPASSRTSFTTRSQAVFVVVTKIIVAIRHRDLVPGLDGFDSLDLHAL